MHSIDGNASGFERRSSTRRSGRLSEGALSDDDYDLNAYAVSDGFRPTQAGPASAPSHPSPAATTPQPPPPVALASSPSKDTSDADRPSSTSKPPRAHDSLTLRNDGSSSARRRQSGGPTVLPSISTGVPLIQPETPYQGPSDPSHPYQMYPQRTFSNATVSTAPHADRQSYNGPRGPTHPYALYTQNTAAAEETAQEHIPVGFNGMGNTYQRQLGPDGEEAGDLIGPLGHLEELPPYTRYPEESYARRKSPEPVRDAPPSPVQAIPGAGGLGIATRNPEFSSTEDDLALPRSRPTSRSEASQHEINTAARSISEKPTMTKWQRRARKKMWGIVPYWAIALLVVGLIIMGIVMGAVIGTVLANHDSSDPAGDEQYDSQPTQSAVDVDPLPTLPPDLPPLATGFFALPPLDTSQAPKSCFSDPTQAQAWSCDMPFRFYSMDVSHVPNATDTTNYELTLTAFNASDAKFIWGTQPPDVPDPRPLTLVADAFELGRGPAWWLTVVYDKTVIVSEDNFRPVLSKRGSNYFDTPLADFDPSTFKKKSVGARDGDTPWICTWPNTALEIFIYPSQNVSVPTTTISPGATPTASVDYASPTVDLPPNPIFAYPKVVKFLERRWGDTPQSTASCRQVQIINDGHGTKDLRDKNGNPIVVVISENAKSLEEMLAQRERSRHAWDKRWRPGSVITREALELTNCGCLWWST
ncbi:hypothetical protein TOPH_08920 [Tolypocladium ophioglossoides CBS 100239]|uniref:DUF7820 domain-containing protein n=1 Tax=Tolypocladium ophioglossoides (strain CBS 100239) TaxID=1163406 RepID=A0A0L0MX59_TOLOC|nr:hypothetical protein TOPH_08920 [Tolypocladium ophioglossoides CBS 100239]